MLICVLFAYINKGWIDKGRKVLHAYNGLLHLVAAGVAYWAWSWELSLIVLFEARIVFDIALNKMRGLEFDYVTPDPKSIIDKVEQKIFGDDGVTPKIVYAFFALGLNVIYFI